MELTLFLGFSAILLLQVKGNYLFEVRFHSYNNPTNNDWKDNCCDGCCSCSDPCDVLFFICLRRHGFMPHVSNNCSMGTQTTHGYPYSASYISFTGSNIAGTLTNPAPFSGSSWPGSFQLMVRMDDNDLGNNGLVDRVIVDRDLGVSNSFTSVQNILGIYNKVTLQLSFRLTCNDNYYGSNCTKHCVPSNSNTAGYFVCSTNGDRVCTESYTGIDCLTPVCATGCVQGSCSASGLCDMCDSGWSGSLCEQCQLATGCHADRAYCRQAGQCICIMGYSGALCQIDEDVCGHQTPCRNGGTCTNTESGSYLCQCSVGYTGHNCDVDIDQCVSSPCLNAATCHDLDGPATFECSCATGWTGSLCDDNIDECSLSLPCQNNGTCLDCVPTSIQLVQPQISTILPYCPLGYNCTCMAGHYGDNCEADVDYCISAPCQNGGSCVDIVGGPGYTCTCPLEYTGLDCDVEVNECESSPCLNGATCTDLVGSYSCVCEPGFTGVTCLTNIDECTSSPCHPNNTLECRDEINSFLCVCLPGYTGSDCSMEVDECEVFPCANGGTCTAKVNDFECQCLSGFTGTRCDININNCHPDICLFGGTCVDKVDGYTCLCAPTYTGIQCETTHDLCTSSPCDKNQFCRQNITMDQGFECFSCVAGEAGCGLIISGSDTPDKIVGNKNTVGVVVGAVMGVAGAMVLLVGVVVIIFCLIKKCHCCCFAGVKEGGIDIDPKGQVQNNPLYFGTSTIISSKGTSFNGSYSRQGGAHVPLGGGEQREKEEISGYMSLDTVDCSASSRAELLLQSSQYNTSKEEHIYDYINPSECNTNNDSGVQKNGVSLKGLAITKPSDDDYLIMKPAVQSGKYDKLEKNSQLPDPPNTVDNPYVKEPSIS